MNMIDYDMLSKFGFTKVGDSIMFEVYNDSYDIYFEQGLNNIHSNEELIKIILSYIARQGRDEGQVIMKMKMNRAMK